jgi:lipopolysaccharide/colanic/teichoic acid biosynthesis glycosyltransferase
MILSLPKKSLRADLNFLLALAAGWLALAAFLGCASRTVAVAAAFALAAAFLNYLILKLCGYFDALRIGPRRTDIFTMLFSCITAGMVQQLSISALSVTERCPFVLLVPATATLGLVVYAADFFISHHLIRRGMRRQVVLDLPEAQKKVLSDEIQAMHMSHYIDFLSLKDLRERFLRGAGKELDLIVISRESNNKFDAEGLLIRAHLIGIPIIDVADLSTSLTGRIPFDGMPLSSYILSATRQTPFLRAFSYTKTIIEPLLALFLAVLFLPIMLLMTILIKGTSSGPVFYKQARTGYLGRTFDLVKFRSMYVDAERNGPQWSRPDDDRVTKVGRFMRRTRIDEIPQLWNVFRGDMSFVGPRPERPEIYRDFRKSLPLFPVRTLVRPGITGWAQVRAGYAASIEESALKLEYDLFYIQHMSPRLDLIILIQTIVVAFLGDSAAAPAAASGRRQVKKVAENV